MRRIVSVFRGTRADERGVETAAMIFVLPVLIVLVLGLVDIGFMLQARMAVQSMARDAVRGAAADGGDQNPRTNTIGKSWTTVLMNQLWQGGHCTQSNCSAPPSVDCSYVILPDGAVYKQSTAQESGDMLQCKVHYNYKPINGGILNAPVMGLGIGSMLHPFDVTVTARAETGLRG